MQTNLKLKKYKNMNRIYSKLKTVAILTSIIAISSSCSNKNGYYHAEIYAVNDIHGALFDSLYVDGKTNKTSLANVSAYINSRRAEIGADKVAMLDLGDALQGDNSVFYANYVDTSNSAKHLFSRIVEYIGHDALIVGNHDIETGHNVYDKITAEISVPYLAANAIDKNSGKCYFQPYAIVNKGGIEIAIIGMTNPNIKKWLGEEQWHGIDFLPIEEIAQTLVDEVKKKHNPDFTILAIHAGLGDGSGEDIENPARYLASSLKGIDAVLASHDHQTDCEKIWNGKDSVLVIEGGSRCKNLLKIDIEANYENGRQVAKTLKGELVPMEGLAVDNQYLAAFREDFLKTKAFTNQEIGTLNEEINTVDAFFGPSSYLNLVHSVQLANSGADVSMAAPLTYNGKVEAGKLIYHDLFTIYPFENQLYVISLTGKQILDCLEYSYDTWISTMSSSKEHLLRINYNEKHGRYDFVYPAFNFDSAAGVIYDVDVREPFGSRVKIKSMADGTQFDLAKNYKVAMSSYRANGGGDLLTKGASIPKEELSSIILEKKDDIRGMIYKFYRSGNTVDKMIEAQWKFIPEPMVKEAIQRDRALVFGKK